MAHSRRRLALLIVLALGLTRQVKAAEPEYRRTVARYDIPNVVLVDQDGVRVRLRELLNTDKRVVMNFFFTSCTTICPLVSAGFSTLQETLGSHAGDVRIVSIAIDPDHDTPSVLRNYRERLGAGPEWQFVTGTKDDVDRVRKAFDAYTPGKTTHRPLSYLRSPGSDSWVRIDGLMSNAELMAEFRSLRRP